MANEFGSTLTERRASTGGNYFGLGELLCVNFGDSNDKLLNKAPNTIQRGSGDSKMTEFSITDMQAEIHRMRLELDSLRAQVRREQLTVQDHSGEILRLATSRSIEGDRLNYLLHKLRGDALREVVGELSDTSDGAEFRAAIDRAMHGT